MHDIKRIAVNHLPHLTCVRDKNVGMKNTKLRNYLYYECICSYLKTERTHIIKKLVENIQKTIEYDSRHDLILREQINLYEMEYIKNNILRDTASGIEALIKRIIFDKNDIHKILAQYGVPSIYHIILHKMSSELNDQKEIMKQNAFNSSETNNNATAMISFVKLCKVGDLSASIDNYLCNKNNLIDLSTMCQNSLYEYTEINL